MRKSIPWRLAPILAAALVIQIGAGALPAAAAVPTNAAATSAALLRYMNAERAERAMSPVGRSASLNRTAQAWAEHLASQARMYHSSDPAKGSGFNWRGENLAYWEGQPPLTAEKLHRDMWMQSTVHRNNIVHPGYSHAGFGMACQFHDGIPWVFAVVHFGGPSGPVQGSSPGTVSGNGSTPGMTCGGSAPEPAPAPVEPDPAPEQTEPEPSPPAQNASPGAPQNDQAPVPMTGGSTPAPTSGPETPAPSAPQTSTSASPTPSPDAAAEPNPPINQRAIGTVERSNAGLWLAAGVMLGAMALATRRRMRWAPRRRLGRR